MKLLFPVWAALGSCLLAACSPQGTSQPEDAFPKNALSTPSAGRSDDASSSAAASPDLLSKHLFDLSTTVSIVESKYADDANLSAVIPMAKLVDKGISDYFRSLPPERGRIIKEDVDAIHGAITSMTLAADANDPASFEAGLATLRDKHLPAIRAEDVRPRN